MRFAIWGVKLRLCREIPVVNLNEEAFRLLKTGQDVFVNATAGEVVIRELGGEK